MGPVPTLVLLVWAALASGCDAGKVLVYPMDGSHWLNMKILVEALHARGHRVTVLRSSTSWYVSESSPYYESITVVQEEAQNIESQDFMNSFLGRAIEIRRNRGSLWAFFQFYAHIYKMIGQNQQVVANFVTSILENGTLTKQLQDAAFDLCLTDPGFPAGVLLGRYLKLPLVFNVRWLFDGEAHMAVAPSPLSYVPVLFSHHSDQMDFAQRLKNVVYHGMLLYMKRYYSSPPYQAVCDRYFGPGVTPMSLILEADLWLMRVDFVFEYPRPTMPNVVYIGGFHAKPSGPLPADLEEFVESSGEHGVVVMTLGTLLSDLGPETSEVFAAAFARLPQKVVWRFIGAKPAGLGNNTRLVEWLPQNDLLGHPKTRAFVTHGGTNGLYEAIYHGVPVVGVPLIFDQYDNILRMKARGVAELLEVTELDVEAVVGALRSVLDPAGPHKPNMLKLSRLHRDKPVPPLDSALYWIEYVMRHGGAPHLRTGAYKLPWYVYHSLDVAAFLAACGLLVAAALWFSCKRLVGCFYAGGKSKCD